MVAYTRPPHAPGSVQGRRASDAAQRRASDADAASGGHSAASFAQVVAGAVPRATGRTGVGTPGGPHPTSILDALADALRSERKLVDDLADTMRRQRAAVAVDDLPTIDDTVFATHRLLATLGQARLRRKQVNRLLGGADDLPLRHLEACVGPQMTDALREARDLLADAATALSAEVDVNRRVLRDALAHGEQHARVLAGGQAAGHGAGHPGGPTTAASLAEADAGARYAAIAAAGTNPAGARARTGDGRVAGPLLVNRTA
jgi:hypothetical protein